MPRALVATAIKSPTLVEYEDQPLGPNEIRAITIFGSPKHGTELHMYRGDSPFGESHYDSTEGLFLPGTADHSLFPMSLGNIAVARVTEVGSEVEGFAIGDQVAGYGPLRETQTWRVDSERVYPGVRKMPEGMSPETAVMLDPLTVALGGVRDGGVKVGDRVAVFGLGAIGLAVVGLAKIAGASWVAASDPIPQRREVARRLGATLTIDPTTTDAGLEIHRAAGIGVDVSLETSGSARGLQAAIRALAFGGTVALCAWYNEFRGGLDFGREAHFNRPRFVFPRAESEPHYDHPRWNNLRQAQAAWGALVAAQAPFSEVIYPIVDFADSAEAYREIDEHPERSVKLGVRFPA